MGRRCSRVSSAGRPLRRVIGGPPCQMFSAMATLVRANGGEPRFGNLIPEFERCCRIANPKWFVMENVPKAPLPEVPDYDVEIVHSEKSLAARRWAVWSGPNANTQIQFWRQGGASVNLMRFIELAPLHLPEPSGAISADHPGTQPVRRKAVFGDGRPTRKEHRRGAVTSSDGGATVRMNRYTVEEAAELQGLPTDFLDDAPFTRDGKLKAIANGVPLPMGRAIAKAVKEAIGGF
jgi:DNA (cytosine-5)-methyltransferase 1